MNNIAFDEDFTSTVPILNPKMKAKKVVYFFLSYYPLSSYLFLILFQKAKKMKKKSIREGVDEDGEGEVDMVDQVSFPSLFFSSFFF